MVQTLMELFERDRFAWVDKDIKEILKFHKNVLRL